MCAFRSGSQIFGINYHDNLILRHSLYLHYVTKRSKIKEVNRKSAVRPSVKCNGGDIPLKNI